MRTLILAVLLGGCHKPPAVDPELERVKADQRALAAKVEALQAQLDHAPPPPARPIAPIAATPPEAPRVRPLLTNIDTAETGAVVTTRAPAAEAPSVPSGALHTEDLHGTPVGGAANPPALGAGATGISESEGAAMLEQLQAQMKQLKSSQAAQQSALDQLEQMR